MRGSQSSESSPQAADCTSGKEEHALVRYRYMDIYIYIYIYIYIQIERNREIYVCICVAHSLATRRRKLPIAPLGRRSMPRSDIET